MSSVSKRTWLIVLLSQGIAGWFAAVAVAADWPNILVILADDMGFGDVQALNPDSKIPTPNLNALSQSGMTFSDAHSPSAVCTPTRYGLLTGRYCWRTTLKSGVLGGYSKPLLETGRRTIGDLAKAHGYHTGAIGKWHLGMSMPYLGDDEKGLSQWEGDPGIDFGGVISNSPIHHGFDYYFGVSASLDMAPYVFVRNDRFTALPVLQQPAVKFPHFVRKGPRADDFVIADVLDRLTEEAIAFIDDAAKRDAPFLLYVPLTGPHKPTQPHERFRGKTSLGEYGDFVHQVDATVGRILAALDANQVAENTLVIYTSDNGSYMFRYDDPQRTDHVDDNTIQGFRSERHRANGPFRGTKADIYEAGHHVPFFVRWPKKLEPGRVCDSTICLTDVYASLAELFGADLAANEAEDSCSILPMLKDPSQVRPDPVVHHSVNGSFAIRDGQWKLILTSGSGGREKPTGKPFDGAAQLYDMVSDSGESTNLAEDHPEVVERLTKQLEDFRQSGRSVRRK